MRTTISLRTVAPWFWHTVLAFGIFNLFLGVVFILSYLGSSVSVANVFPNHFWGVIFLVMGVSTFYGVIRNDWVVMRYTQLAGVLIKTIWAIALILVSISSPQASGVAAVWLLLEYFQLIVFIYFPIADAGKERFNVGNKHTNSG